MTPHELAELMRANPDLAAANDAFADINEALFGPPAQAGPGSEHDEQVKVFAWARAFSEQQPLLRLLFAVPNGGARHPAVAAKLKAEGVKAGVPDILFPVARGGYHGLAIELKWDRNKPTREQQGWLDALTAEGWQTCVAYGFEEARQAIQNYLRLEET